MSLDVSRAVDGDGTDVVPPPVPDALQIVQAAHVLKDTRAERKARASVIRQVRAETGTPEHYARSLMAKPVPEDWERDLREISPVSDAISSLVFSWKKSPLDIEGKDARWCLYEAIPDALIDLERRIELQSAPFWDKRVYRTKGAMQAQATVVSAYQWVMYHDHRVDVRPFWCLQGKAGGTPLAFTRMEKRYLTLMGKPSEPDAVGAFPYAPWDARARRAVLERDRVVKLGLASVKQSGDPVLMALAKQQAEKDFRRAFWDYTAENLRPNADLLEYILRHEGHNPSRRQQTKEESEAAHEAREIFIETGRVPSEYEFKHRQQTFAVSR